MEKLTGPTSRIEAEIRQARRLAQQEARMPDRVIAMHEGIAKTLIADHHSHGVSYETCYGVDLTPSGRVGNWVRFGPAEDHGALLSQRDYFTVSNRDSWRDVAWKIGGHTVSDYEQRRLASLELFLETFLDASAGVAPMVEIGLALRVHNGGLEWDTNETLAQAARRITLMAGDVLYQEYERFNRRLEHVMPTEIRHRVLADAMGMLGLDGEPAQYAAEYLAAREEVEESLRREGIEWGGALLALKETAARVKVSDVTWRAYVSRGQAPGPDKTDPNRWRPATLEAWQATRHKGEKGSQG